MRISPKEPALKVLPRWPWGVVAVTGPSMEPTLRAGDFLVVRRGVRPRAGDVVVASFAQRPDLLVVKRAMHRLPDGTWWLTGDNPAASDDSARYGPVPREDVVGRAVFRYWPLRTAGPIRRRQV